MVNPQTWNQEERLNNHSDLHHDYPKTTVVSVSLDDESYQARVRRSIDHLRYASRLGVTFPGSDCPSPWRRELTSRNGDHRRESFHRRRRTPNAANARQSDAPTSLPTKPVLRIADDSLRQQHTISFVDGGDDNRRVGDGEEEEEEEEEAEDDAVSLLQHQKNHRGERRGRLMLIIDVQSRQGAVEEVCVYDGDNAFLLAEDFVVRHDLGLQYVAAVGVHILAKVRETGFTADLDGRCWASLGTVSAAINAATGSHPSGSSDGPAVPGDHSSFAALSVAEGNGDGKPERRSRRRRRRPGSERSPIATPVIADPDSAGRGDVGGDARGVLRRVRKEGVELEEEERGDEEEEGWDVDEDEWSCFGRRFDGGGRCGSEARSLRLRRRRRTEGQRDGSVGADDRWRSTGFGGGHRERYLGSQRAGHLDHDRNLRPYSLQAPDSADSLLDGGGGGVSPTDDRRSGGAGGLGRWGHDDGRGEDARGKANCVVLGADRNLRGEASGRRDQEIAFSRARSSWSGGPLAETGVGASSGYQYFKNGRSNRSMANGGCGSSKNVDGRAASAATTRSGSGFNPRIVGDGGSRGKHASPISGRCRRDSAATLFSPARSMGTRDMYCGGRGRGSAENGAETLASGWESAPDEGGSMRREWGDGRRGAGWRSRGALGRRPVSREAARQKQASERLYRLADTMARRRESTRRRRDDVLRAREALVNSGRLNLCPKTRELTAKLSKYTYGRGSGNGNGRNGRNGRNGDTKGDDDDGDGDCRERGARSGGSSGYRDAGDRLYSEWEATRRRKARRQEVEDEAHRRGAGAVTAKGGVSSEGAWSCPKCGADNRAQDDTCQTVTGIAVPAQQLRPGTWCRESCEKLGRVAAAAAVAAGGRDGGCSRDKAGTTRMGDDGLRRCGRRRPPMFQPTRLARWEDGFGSTRPRGDVRGGPTARRKNRCGVGPDTYMQEVN